MMKNILTGVIAFLLFAIMIPLCIIASNSKPIEQPKENEMHTYITHVNIYSYYDYWSVDEVEFNSKNESGKLLSYNHWNNMNPDKDYQDFIDAGYSDLNGNYKLNDTFYWYKIN